MSDASVQAPVKEAHSPVPEHPPADSAAKALTVDVLNTCTARFDREGWNLFLAWREDLEAIRFNRIRVQLEARSEVGAVTIQQLLCEAHVPAVKREGQQLEMVTTFEKLQRVIRHPETRRVRVRTAETGHKQ